jgi:hypothetical protein
VITRNRRPELRSLTLAGSSAQEVSLYFLGHVCPPERWWMRSWMAKFYTRTSWSLQRNAQFRECYPIMSADELAIAFSVTKPAVKSRAFKLGLLKKDLNANRKRRLPAIKKSVKCLVCTRIFLTPNPSSNRICTRCKHSENHGLQGVFQ